MEKTGFRNTHSSEKMDWQTPDDLFYFIEEKLGEFDLDACASDENALCSLYFTKNQDCLLQDWSQNGQVNRVYCNPPYGKNIPKILEKAKSESFEKGITVAVLVFVRCDTRWWHNTVPYASEVWLFKGRIKFDHPEHTMRSCATAPSCLIIFNGKHKDKDKPVFIHVDYRQKDKTKQIY
tara:strand:- start:57 stop:593 length:537 start_codon:yes stop_codon:yes gene_type:complete